MNEQNDLTRLNDEWFERVWNKHEREAIFELISDDCHIGGLPPSEKVPKQAFADFYDTILATFDRFTITTEVWAQEGDTIVGQGRIQALHRVTNRDVDFRFAYRAVWQNGLITQADNIVDWLTPLTQTGCQSDSCLEQLLQQPT